MAAAAASSTDTTPIITAIVAAVAAVGGALIANATSARSNVTAELLYEALNAVRLAGPGEVSTAAVEGRERLEEFLIAPGTTDRPTLVSAASRRSSVS